MSPIFKALPVGLGGGGSQLTLSRDARKEENTMATRIKKIAGLGQPLSGLIRTGRKTAILRLSFLLDD